MRPSSADGHQAETKGRATLPGRPRPRAGIQAVRKTIKLAHCGAGPRPLFQAPGQGPKSTPFFVALEALPCPIQRLPKDTKGYQRFPKDTKGFQRIPKKSLVSFGNLWYPLDPFLPEQVLLFGQCDDVGFHRLSEHRRSPFPVRSTPGRSFSAIGATGRHPVVATVFGKPVGLFLSKRTGCRFAAWWGPKNRGWGLVSTRSGRAPSLVFCSNKYLFNSWLHVNTSPVAFTWPGSRFSPRFLAAPKGLGRTGSGAIGTALFGGAHPFTQRRLPGVDAGRAAGPSVPPNRLDLKPGPRPSPARLSGEDPAR